MNAPVTEMQGETTLMIRRVFDTDMESLFRALTDPAAVRQWFGPGAVRCIHAEGDIRVGGRWAIAMRSPDDQPHDVSGEYTEVDPPRKVSFTWAWASTPERVSQVTYALSPAESGGTTLTLTHERFADSDARDRHSVGWNGGLDKLGPYLAGLKG